MAHAGYLNGYDALLHHADFTCGGHREVDNATGSERPAVGHLDHYLAAVLLVAHLKQRAKGKGAVGAGETVFVITRTVARAAAVKFVAIIGGLALVLSQGSGGGKGEDGC